MFRIRSKAAFAFCLFLSFWQDACARSTRQIHRRGGEDKTLILVSRPELGDPLFKESVVLMFPSSVVAIEGVVFGLIINRPVRVALCEIFPDDDALKNRSETAYFGGRWTRWLPA